MEERLQKILAQAGFGSRRSCETLIVAKRVRVNGRIAELGSKADAQKDTISVDGQNIPKPAAHVYIILNKPREVLSDTDPMDPRTTVFDLVKQPGHLFAVGRLDYDSEGLNLADKRRRTCQPFNPSTLWAREGVSRFIVCETRRRTNLSLATRGCFGRWI